MKALEYDEKGNYNEALNLYTEGAELGLLEVTNNFFEFKIFLLFVEEFIF